MTNSNKRKLYRSKNDKILAGIFGGLGEHFDIDPNLLRVIVLFLIFLTFFGALVPFLIVYFISMFIIPSDREKGREESENENKNKDENSPSKPVYKNWLFWLIIVIFLFPIILITLGFFLFSARTGVVTDSIEVSEEIVKIEQPEDDYNYIEDMVGVLGDPYITGYIINITEEAQSLLVAEGLKTVEYTGDIEELEGNAIYLTIDEKTKIRKKDTEVSLVDLNVEEKVTIWVTGPVLESYPARGTAFKIVVIE